MTKLNYPSDGLTSKLSNEIETVKQSLNNAVKVNLNIPFNFSGRAELNEIISDIKSILKNHKDFNELIMKIDNNYENVNNKIADNFNEKKMIRISKREKII